MHALTFRVHLTNADEFVASWDTGGHLVDFWLTSGGHFYQFYTILRVRIEFVIEI